MDQPSLIRFYLVVQDAGLEYLEALAAAKLRVKPCPIGPAFLTGRWAALMELFNAPMPGQRYVNMVCAPPSFPLGSPLRADPCDPRSGTRTPGANDTEIVYKPSTAFAGLYTVGVPNVAVVLGHDRPSDDEIVTLGKYNAVFTPTEAAAEDLRRRGVSQASMVFPEPRELSKLLSLFTDTL